MGIAGNDVIRRLRNKTHHARGTNIDAFSAPATLRFIHPDETVAVEMNAVDRANPQTTPLPQASRLALLIAAADKKECAAIPEARVIKRITGGIPSAAAMHLGDLFFNRQRGLRARCVREPCWQFMSARQTEIEGGGSTDNRFRIRPAAGKPADAAIGPREELFDFFQLCIPFDFEET
jgi:hypothetical protein